MALARAEVFCQKRTEFRSQQRVHEAHVISSHKLAVAPALPLPVVPILRMLQAIARAAKSFALIVPEIDFVEHLRGEVPVEIEQVSCENK